MATRRSVLSFAALAGGVALAALSSARPSAHIPIGTSVTWNHDVAGILERRCLSCHRDGGPGPMALTSYDIARPWARAIREEVLERRMPPTGLRSGGGLYENARGLSLAEVELLVSWADGGAPQGTGDEVKTPGHELAHLETTLPLTLVPGDAPPLQRTLKVALPSGWIAAWTFDPGPWPAVSAALRLPNRAVMGDWTAGDPPVEYPAGVGLQIATANALTIDVSLARPLTDEAMATMPSLRVRRASGPLRAVARRTVQDSTAVPGLGEQLLAFKLGLADPAASAELIVVRSSGEEDFLLVMGPPGLPDTVSYRLRAPVTLKKGDTVQVRSTSAFSLGIESVASAPARSVRGAK